MTKRFISLILLLGCLLTGTAQQHNGSGTRPKLVLGIVVDQLRTDYLESLQGLMGEKGFRMLMRGGVYMRNVEFSPARLDAVSATAMLFSGTTPDKTGVPAAYAWSAADMKRVPVLNDPETLGNFTSETYSPRHLRTSTITDEVMIDGAGLAMAHAIAVDPQQAVIMAGHAGTGALWLNTNSGKWSTSTYYGDMPQVASRRNYSLPLSSRVDTMQWKPMLPLERYPGLPAQKRMYEFRHTFPSSAKEVYEKFAASPKSNTEITDLAVDYLNSLKAGQRGDAVDMLCLGYTAAPFKYVKDGDFRLELSDTYLRLDKDLERLFAAVDKAVGLQNTFIFLCSTGYYDDATLDDAKYRIPTGDFSVKRAISLLNAFMTARYGQGNYVEAYADGALYFNHKLLEQRKVDIYEASRAAKEFLLKMSGVDAVYTLSDILSASSADEEALRLCIDPRSGVDLLLEVTPGWVLVDDTQYPAQSRSIRRGKPLSPAMILSPRVSPAVLSTPVSATALAPTITTALHMRAPNAAATPPVLLSPTP